MQSIVANVATNSTTHMDNFLSTSYYAAVTSVNWTAMVPAQPRVRLGDVRPFDIVLTSDPRRQASLGGGLWRVFNPSGKDFYVNHVDADELVTVVGWHFPDANDRAEIATASNPYFDYDSEPRLTATGWQEREPQLHVIFERESSVPNTRNRWQRWTVTTEAGEAA